MPFALFALAMINFAVGTQGFAFAGVLSELSRDLGVTIGQAGLIVGASSITFALGAPFAAAAVAQIERRRVIVTGLAALALVNLLCAVAPSFAALTALRIAAGLATAFVGALATVAAASLVAPEKRGRAFAIVMGGLTVAFVLGVPLGSVIGGLYGWRATFAMSAMVCLGSVVLVALTVPAIAPAAGARPRLGDVLGNGRVVRVLMLTLIGFAATFTVVSFVGPVITATTGLTGARIGALQAFIGFGSLVGLALGGIASDRGRGPVAAAVACAAMSLSLLLYWLALSAPHATVPALAMGLLMFAGATALFSLIPLNLAAITLHAGTSAPVALALNGSLVSLGQGLGALLGGALTDAFGAAAMGPGGAVLAGMGFLLALTIARRDAAPAVKLVAAE
ncbi:putative permease of the major facilitator superfamily (MFS) [Bradyrhizobium sp. ORS 278]|uniref:MFS transporter n=1 Tax=Bradyrhizobium sp. (strain ORS 278) TaxID=114615 RepID=UPI0001508E85|nr:MFS transporter [Bradyrhizobium sp. ORS 278]CAL78373.1 putative permease of the major facilitator superfamily (MFS) [Bradyrhizobium sp. ORS 278]